MTSILRGQQTHSKLILLIDILIGIMPGLQYTIYFIKKMHNSKLVLTLSCVATQSSPSIFVSFQHNIGCCTYQDRCLQRPSTHWSAIDVCCLLPARTKSQAFQFMRIILVIADILCMWIYGKEKILQEATQQASTTIAIYDSKSTNQID
jgi:hypothetical protein